MMKIGMRRKGKEVAFQEQTYFLKTINIQHVFNSYSKTYMLGKTNLDFTNKMKRSLVINFLWTTY